MRTTSLIVVLTVATTTASAGHQVSTGIANSNKANELIPADTLSSSSATGTNHHGKTHSSRIGTTIEQTAEERVSPTNVIEDLSALAGPSRSAADFLKLGPPSEEVTNRGKQLIRMPNTKYPEDYVNELTDRARAMLNSDDPIPLEQVVEKLQSETKGNREFIREHLEPMRNNDMKTKIDEYLAQRYSKAQNSDAHHRNDRSDLRYEVDSSLRLGNSRGTTDMQQSKKRYFRDGETADEFYLDPAIRPKTLKNTDIGYFTRKTLKPYDNAMIIHFDRWSQEEKSSDDVKKLLSSHTPTLPSNVITRDVERYEAMLQLKTQIKELLNSIHPHDVGEEVAPPAS